MSGSVLTLVTRSVSEEREHGLAYASGYDSVADKSLSHQHRVGGVRFARMRRVPALVQHRPSVLELIKFKGRLVYVKLPTYASRKRGHLALNFYSDFRVPFSYCGPVVGFLSNWTFSSHKKLCSPYLDLRKQIVSEGYIQYI